MRTYLRHLIILFIVLFHTPFQVAAQNTDKDILRSGRLLFQVNCSRCHGMLGGGGTGPNLIQSYLPRASTDEDQ